MPRLHVTDISPSHLRGSLEAGGSDAQISVRFEDARLGEFAVKNGTFEIPLSADQVRAGQTVALWLSSDPTVHVVVPLRLGVPEAHNQSEELALLRAELELVKAALRKLAASQGQG